MPKIPKDIHDLIDTELADGWIVREKRRQVDGETGGHFSVGYIVERQRNGVIEGAFLKAIDLSRALAANDPIAALYKLTKSVEFEKEILELCNTRNMDRVIRFLNQGNLRCEQISAPIPYLIFEKAERSVSARTARITEPNPHQAMAWGFRVLHHIAVGLTQLHGARVAHQDLKPSNVLLFEGDQEAKLGDLGRSSLAGVDIFHDALVVPGDKSYAPPELLYGYIAPDWQQRRHGCDAYLFGSMIVYIFSGVPLTPLLRECLETNNPRHVWGIWQGTYREVLPYVREAFEQCLEIINQTIHIAFRDVVITSIRELCEPDPDLRGHPLNRTAGQTQYSLERYVAQMNLLAGRSQFLAKEANSAETSTGA